MSDPTWPAPWRGGAPSFDLLDGMEPFVGLDRCVGRPSCSWRKRGGGEASRLVSSTRTDDNLALRVSSPPGLGHACIGRFAARRAIDSSLTFARPRDVSQRARWPSALPPRELQPFGRQRSSPRMQGERRSWKRSMLSSVAKVFRRAVG